MPNVHMTLAELFSDTAEAIREKTGETGEIVADNFPTAIRGISARDKITHSFIPEYVKAEAMAVAERVRAVQTANTVTFLAMSDFHHLGNQSHSYQANVNAGNLHALQAVKCLAYNMDFDFACILGDTAWGGTDTTDTLLKEQIGEIHSLLDEGLEGTPAFFTPGNHDTGVYGSLVGAEYLYSAFASRNEGASELDNQFGYCYRDFTDKRLRVICLNSCEGEALSGNNAAYIFSPAQLLWFAQRLYEVGSMTGWRVMVICHYPLDCAGAYPASNLLKAYIEGGSTTQNGTTVNFSGHNAARVVANLHGHIHNLKTDKLSSVTNGVATQYDAKRVSIPNACFYRSNEVGENGEAERWGIEYGEETTYNKTANTAKDTAFVIGVDDPDSQLLHLFCYGAGYDRVVSYSPAVYYSISKNLTYASVSSDIAVVEQGEGYTASVTANDGYELSSVTVRMGGIDITQTAYSSETGVVDIAEVTGDILITAMAVKQLSYTNLVDTAVDTSGNSAPYTDGYRIGSSGGTSSESGATVTGFIPFDGGVSHTYRIGGEGISFYAYGGAIAWYKSDFTLSGKYPCTQDKIGSNDSQYPIKLTPETGISAAFQTHSGQHTGVAYPKDAAYFRVSARGSGANLIVTVDEVIE